MICQAVSEREARYGTTPAPGGPLFSPTRRYLRCPPPGRFEQMPIPSFATMTGAGACANTPGVADPVRRTNMGERTCSVEGCEKSHHARGWCYRHYILWSRYGDPTFTPAPRLPWPERLWTRIDKTETCWLWKGGIGDKGYGFLRGANGQRTPAHRATYELVIGPVPAGLQLDHLCRVRHCVNPAHLEPVTCQENIRRARLAVSTRGASVRRLARRTAGRDCGEAA